MSEQPDLEHAKSFAARARAAQEAINQLGAGKPNAHPRCGVRQKNGNGPCPNPATVGDRCGVHSPRRFRDSRYANLTREQLELRLLAAERVCAVFGWMAVENSERGKAAYVLWQRWVATGGNPEVQAWPELTEGQIADFARIADERRRLTLAGQAGPHGEHLPQ